MAEGGGAEAAAGVLSAAEAWPAPSNTPAAEAIARIRTMIKSPGIVPIGRIPRYYCAFPDETKP